MWSSLVDLSPFTRRLLWISGALVLLLALAVFFAFNSLYSPLSNTDDGDVFEVSAGSSLSLVADQLNEVGYLDSPLLFKILARLRGVENTIQVGEYRLEPGLTPASLLDKMVAGDTIQYRVTLVEGWTFREALEEVWRSEKIVIELEEENLQQIAEILELENSNPEGMLFPDTYFYTKGTSDLDILRRAQSRLEQVLAEEWDSGLAALPYESPYEALIMASIIEKESGVGSERGHIAGVFIRRLEQGMRLQSDPTVIYGMADSYDGDIRRDDLANETPYNTYRVNGLPPTPIALAGRESIAASMNPIPSDYLYFVSRGDGSHYFSSTLEEHNNAVNRFQRQTQ